MLLSYAPPVQRSVPAGCSANTDNSVTAGYAEKAV